MASLERNLRKDLERAIKRARNVAEAGARQAIAQLGVGEAESPRHLTAEQRALRTGLRAHGRQLGDRRDPKTGTQATAHLAQECAYEHWHRMLFARFLAETELLIEPESGVSIALEEVQELAREKGADWLPLASDYAERMLPQIFRKDDPVLDIALPPEARSELEDLLEALPKAVFEADDSLGWVYQFWQAEKKDEINKSEVKIGADELPAVTQLFTEDYMVLFLLHNTLGAWWAGKVLARNPALAASASSEDALRAACRVGDLDWTYLRFVRDEAENGAEGTWRPAAGTFDGWPKAAKDITMLDPCMGSGHFLVFALPILVAFRIAEEGLNERDAIDAVLRDNLFGLEIDPRCTQIAAFNLAFAAWKRTGFHVLPRLNLACSGLDIGATKAEWLKLAEKAVSVADPAAKRDLLGVEQNLLTYALEERVKNGLEALYDLFAKAPWLGSLIDPRRTGGDIFRESFEKLEPVLASILAAADTDEAREIAVAAQGFAKAAGILSKEFDLIVTNVPYLGRGKQHDILKNYCDSLHKNAKTDLSTCFVERCLKFCSNGGTAAAVTPQNWLFLGSYSKLRVDLLKHSSLNLVCDLGPAAFNEMNWWAARTALVGLTSVAPDRKNSYLAVHADTGRDLAQKPKLLSSGEFIENIQAAQLGNPDARISVYATEASDLLANYADVYVGFQNGDTPRWIQNFWEQDRISDGWTAFQLTAEQTRFFDGRHSIIKWDDGKGELVKSEQAFVKGREAWNKRGVIVRQMRHLPAGLYLGDMYDQSSSVIVPKDPENLIAIATFVMSDDFHTAVRRVDPSVAVTNATFVKVPFDIQKWSEAGRAQFPSGLPAPKSDDPSQWLFDGLPNGSAKPLIVGVSRLLNYQWPRQTGSNFMDCPATEDDQLGSQADDDGIVCLTALKGEPPAEHRLNTLLAGAFGIDWSAAKLANLLAEAGFAAKTLDDWLRDGFFEQHCELFHQRPFIWHIWDGRRDGFHALVNYHRLAAPNGEGRRTLEKLIYSYLGDWIDRQRAEQKTGVEGADARLAHAEHLRTVLIKILEGEPPYDIFVRWKPLHEQPIGWDPDINDGVRLNIRPFLMARPLGAKAKGACILRTTPKIKWDKDRGKEPNRDKADFPWFWSWDEASTDFAGGATFDGNRWNDLHYSRSVKQTARARHAANAGRKL
jgi:hypothetical protein